MKQLKTRLFQVRSNCKKFVTGVRRQSAKAGSVAIQRDFAEALKIEHQKEVQAMHFEWNVSVSIEGCACHFPCPDDGTKMWLDFHSFLSDDLQQMASTVGSHMKKLVKS